MRERCGEVRGRGAGNGYGEWVRERVLGRGVAKRCGKRVRGRGTGKERCRGALLRVPTVRACFCPVCVLFVLSLSLSLELKSHLDAEDEGRFGNDHRQQRAPNAELHRPQQRLRGDRRPPLLIFPHSRFNRVRSSPVGRAQSTLNQGSIDVRSTLNRPPNQVVSTLIPLNPPSLSLSLCFSPRRDVASAASSSVALMPATDSSRSTSDSRSIHVGFSSIHRQVSLRPLPRSLLVLFLYTFSILFYAFSSCFLCLSSRRFPPTARRVQGRSSRISLNPRPIPLNPPSFSSPSFPPPFLSLLPPSLSLSSLLSLSLFPSRSPPIHFCVWTEKKCGRSCSARSPTLRARSLSRVLCAVVRRGAHLAGSAVARAASRAFPRPNPPGFGPRVLSPKQRGFTRAAWHGRAIGAELRKTGFHGEST